MGRAPSINELHVAETLVKLGGDALLRTGVNAALMVNRVAARSVVVRVGVEVLLVDREPAVMPEGLNRTVADGLIVAAALDAASQSFSTSDVRSVERREFMRQ